MLISRSKRRRVLGSWSKRCFTINLIARMSPVSRSTAFLTSANVPLPRLSHQHPITRVSRHHSRFEHLISLVHLADLPFCELLLATARADRAEDVSHIVRLCSALMPERDFVTMLKHLSLRLQALPVHLRVSRVVIEPPASSTSPASLGSPPPLYAAGTTLTIPISQPHTSEAFSNSQRSHCCS